MNRARPLGVAATRPVGVMTARQMVFVFPELKQFDPNCIRLVTRGRDPDTTVACFLGFLKLVCEHDYEKVLRASHEDGVCLEEVQVNSAFVRQHLCELMTTAEPDATMDDFYLLLSVMLCNLPRARGSNLGRGWFQSRVNDLLTLFPAVSGPPPVPLYGEAQADAISTFGEQWPYTRAALCSAVLKNHFEGPMRQVQEYMTVGWRFAGMKHVHLILEFLSGDNSWVLDIIPELRANGYRLQEFLQAYKRLGSDGPYMKLLHLPEAATALRKNLGLHVAAAYALAVLQDENWLRYKGVPRDRAEEEVFNTVTSIRRMGLSAPPHRADPSSSAAAATAQDDVIKNTIDYTGAGDASRSALP
ncbi:hypothetical protein MTO96_006995 [Rhipicephalus appendiculatus]